MLTATERPPGMAATLSRLVPFQDCDPEQLEHVAAATRRIVVPAGTRLVTAGTRGDELYIVVSGAVRVTGPDLEGVLGPGDLVGELSVLGGEPRNADVVTTEPSELLAVDRDSLAILLEIPPVATRLRAIAGARAAIEQRSIVRARDVPVVLPPPRLRGRGAGLHARRDVPARPARTIVLAVVAVVVGLATAWFLTERNRATEVTLDQVLAQAREGTAPATAGTAVPADPLGLMPDHPAGTTDGPGTADSGPGGPDPSSGTASSSDPDSSNDDAAATPADQVAEPQPSEPGSGGSGDGAPGPAEPAPSEATNDSTAARTFRPPLPGVYSYDTTGSERISIAGASHEYPEETYSIVRTDEGCGWRAEHQVLEEHVDIHDRCSQTDSVFVVMDGREIEFFGQRDSLYYYCDPPARLMWNAPAGTTSTGTCVTEEGDSETDYVGEFVGFETLDVGGEATRTAHLHIEFTMRGTSRGTSTADFWLHPETGLIVREERTVDTLAHAVWGDVHYEEEATFQLQSLVPRE